MSSFILKIIALIAMTFDHTGKVLLFNNEILLNIGRIAFPLFAFQIVEGYHHTKNIKKYLLRLLIVALFAQFAYSQFFDGFNTIFTLIIGLICIIIIDKEKDIPIKISLLLTIFLLSLILNIDYGLIGVLIIICFYLFRNNKIKRSMLFSLLVIISYGITYFQNPEFSYIINLFATLSSLIFINLYNNKQGPKLKYLFYIYYPLHLYILWIIQVLIK